MSSNSMKANRKALKTGQGKDNANRIVFLGNSITEGWVRTDFNFFIKNNRSVSIISGEELAGRLERGNPFVEARI